jgi:preprotein translocase subunit SecA
MSAASISAQAAAWPPAQAELAETLFPERVEGDGNRLDRIAVAAALTLKRQRWLRRRAQQRLLEGVEAALPGYAELGDAALRTAAREAARAAFARRDAAAGARALAALSVAARRSLGLRPHRPQLLAAWAMIEGSLIELDTGEGKTLTAALAACLAALAGVPTHVVTVNDYLAQRDAETMMPLFRLLGLSVGIVHAGVAQELRARQYAQALTYCTNKDLVFDYLRDRVNSRGLASMAQLAVRQLHGGGTTAEPLRLRGLHFAIVDEADSVLIDEARTPLILSAKRPGQADAALYAALLALAQELEEELHWLRLPQGGIELLAAGRARLRERAGEIAATQPSEVWTTSWMLEHYALQALRALHLFLRDQHYVVHEGKVVIVDEFTGRMLADRSWEQGLHQLVEVKEGCAPSGGNVTLARITYQSFFARYLRLSGMSGTIRETAAEMAYVFGLACVRIEPNRPSQRRMLAPRLLPDEAAKWVAVADAVAQLQREGRAVLVGTRSVRASLRLSAVLESAGVAHRVLNALQNADEAALVGAAGQPGAVTVATNMAGRGTDIRLAGAVKDCGGLHVLLTEWHESARIDRQLYGRCARQGDPGSVSAIVALDDELLGLHAWPWLLRGAQALLGGRWPAWAIALLRWQVQGAAERLNARRRRHTLQQDRQMRRQLAFTGAPE